VYIDGRHLDGRGPGDHPAGPRRDELLGDVDIVRRVSHDLHPSRRAWAAVLLLAVVGTLDYAERVLPAVLGRALLVVVPVMQLAAVACYVVATRRVAAGAVPAD
jgi:hypothetical protein